MSVVSAGNCPFGNLGSDPMWDPVTVFKLWRKLPTQWETCL